MQLLIFIMSLIALLKLSPLVVNNATKLGEALKVSPIIIGIIAVAIGTSIPEISTSITASVLGHGDINVGDIIGSSLSQITLIIGLAVLIAGEIKTERRNLFLLGSGVIISSIIAYSIIEKGYISRLNGLILVVTYFALYYVLGNSLISKEYIEKEEKVYDGDYAFTAFWKKYTFNLILSLAGVLISSTFLVSSITSISEVIGIPEFIVSFIAVGIGTSLPELFVGISAIQKGEEEIFIGDVLGSNITDLTLALGAGPLIKPNTITSNFIIPTGSYLILASAIVILIFGINKKIDRKMSLLIISLYFLSFFLI